MTSHVFCNSRRPRRQSWARYSASLRVVIWEERRRQRVWIHRELKSDVVLDMSVSRL